MNLKTTLETMMLLLSSGGIKIAAKFSTFDSITKGYEEVEFLYTTDSEIREKYHGDDNTFVTIFKRFDEYKVDYTGELESRRLKEFVNEHQFPIVIDYTEKGSERIFGQSAIPAVFLFIDQSDASTKAGEEFREVAEKLKGRAFFAQVNMTAASHSRISDFFGVTKNRVPAVRIAQPTDGAAPQKYKMDDDIPSENVEEYYKDYVDGKLRTYLKSEPIPDASGDAVRTVVAQNFKKVVLDPSKDVLIEFYAPWCGHCQRISPLMESAAQKLAKVSNVVIAKMDATANEVEGINVNSYPTFKWYPAYKKHAPVDVTDVTDESSIIAFVKKHSSKKFTADITGEL